MQRKNLFIGLALVLLSGITAFSGTLAWFTTTKTASIRFTDATIRNRSANLLVAYVDSLNTMIATEDVDAFGDAKIDLSVDRMSVGAGFVTDISGDGVNFSKLTFSGISNPNSERSEGISDYKAGEIKDVKLVDTGDADSFLVEFSLKISRDNIATDHGLLVYLGENTLILPRIEDPANYQDTLDENDQVIVTAHSKYVTQQMKNINATKTARLAVNSVDENLENHETLFVYAQHEEDVNLDPQYMYIEKDANGSVYGYDGYKLTEQTEVRNGAVSELSTPIYKKGREVTVHGDGLFIGPRYFDFTSGFKYYQNKEQIDRIIVDDFDVPLPDWQQPANYGLIADLSTNNNTEAYLNFRLWIEGTDNDALIDIVGGVFTLELDLYTVEVLRN